jgi:hypothetical protein
MVPSISSMSMGDAFEFLPGSVMMPATSTNPARR